MKEQFIQKWSSWWLLHDKGKELTEAFRKELEAVIAESTIQDKTPRKDRQYYCLSSRNLVDGKRCEKWCGLDACSISSYTKTEPK